MYTSNCDFNCHISAKRCFLMAVSKDRVHTISYLYADVSHRKDSDPIVTIKAVLTTLLGLVTLTNHCWESTVKE